MKTNSKSSNPLRKGAHGGFRNNKQTHTQGQKRKSFFCDVPESVKKGQQQRTGEGGGPPEKRGAAVQKTISFKPKRHDRGNERRNNAIKNTTTVGGPHKGQQGHFKRQQHDSKGQNKYNKGHQKAGKRPAAISAVNFDQMFQSKPEKMNYCLAPERLEAQAKAIKYFERQDREKVFERKKVERSRRHKLMTMKTRKGQPVIESRMELLLEKVKKVMGVKSV